MKKWLKADERNLFIGFVDKLESKDIQEERKITLDDDSYEMSVSKGMKLLVFRCKGYAWFEIVNADRDIRLNLDPSNEIRWD